MIALLVATAWADPVAARLPGDTGREVSVVLRSDTAGSAVVWEGARGVGVDVSARSASAFVGLRRTEGPRAGITAGVAVPFASPTLALVASPWLGLGGTGARAFWTVGFAAPAALRLTPKPVVEVPVLLEAGGGARFGDVSLGGGLSIGAVFGGAPPGLAGGLWLTGRWLSDP